MGESDEPPSPPPFLKKNVRSILVFASGLTSALRDPCARLGTCDAARCASAVLARERTTKASVGLSLVFGAPSAAATAWRSVVCEAVACNAPPQSGVCLRSRGGGRGRAERQVRPRALSGRQEAGPRGDARPPVFAVVCWQRRCVPRGRPLRERVLPRAPAISAR